MKEKITKFFYPLLMAVCLLFVMAAILGLKGIFAANLLIVAMVIMFVLLLEATWSRPSFFKYSYRFAILLALGTAFFYNQEKTEVEQICGVLMGVAVCCVLGKIVYYFNNVCTRDAEKRLT